MVECYKPILEDSPSRILEDSGAENNTYGRDPGQDFSEKNKSL